MLPIAAVIVTKNEERNIARCLASLSDFGQVVVVDSESSDRTAAIARESGVELVEFHWNGAYPKKRQWCLEHLPLRYDWVFFIDADEEATPEFLAALVAIDWDSARQAGFFVKGAYVMGGRVLRRGLRNDKLCLLHRPRMEFPVLEDLDIPGMGEIEGHYQPVRKAGFESAPLGRIGAVILHYALEDKARWDARHDRYAQWEAAMDARKLWPSDPSPFRRMLKAVFKAMPLRAEAAFLHSYVLKAGFLDGEAGFALARSRLRYYRLIRDLKKR